MRATIAVAAAFLFLFLAPTATSRSQTSWYDTARCESSLRWHLNTGNGYYGGLQFDHWTWARFGGLRFAYNAHGATPQQQMLVASRVSYDAWPNCPNP